MGECHGNPCICISLNFKAKETWWGLGGIGRLIRTQLNRVLDKEYLNQASNRLRGVGGDEDHEFQGLAWMSTVVQSTDYF